MEHKTDESPDQFSAEGASHKPILQMQEVEKPKRTVPMNIEATDWVHTLPVLRATEKLLLLVLARRSDKHGCSWCRQRLLAAETCCSDRAVRYSLKNLETRQYIRRMGRRAPNGGQTTDVVILVGWPGRRLIPDIGHPTLKKALRETAETRRLWRLCRTFERTKVPAGAETASDNNKETIIKTTTVWLNEALEACFEALGPWVTGYNARRLVDDVPVLRKWLDQGLDLKRDILPVLAEKAKSTQDIPNLHTWRYFEKPIQNLVSRRQQPKSRSQRQQSATRKALNNPTLESPRPGVGESGK